MRLVPVLLLLLLVAGCGTRTADDDGARPGDGPAPVPRAIPAAPGEVTTHGVATVLDDGGGPELCLGGVAESWPPQCDGPPLVGWDWEQQRQVPAPPGTDATGGYTAASGVRWGEYALTGQWDGTSFTVGTVAADSPHGRPPPAVPTPPPPDQPLDEARLVQVQQEAMDRVPGALSASTMEGRVLLQVVYDDGSLQEWLDSRYDPGVVVVTSALVDVRDAG